MNDSKGLLHGLCFDWERPPIVEANSLGEALRIIRGISAKHDSGSVEDDAFYPEVVEFAKHLLPLLKPGATAMVSCDYDVDGVVSGIILSATLRQFGVQPKVFLPDRFIDGYGVGHTAVRKEFNRGGFDFLITADCGSADLPRLSSFGEDARVPIFVIDHHIGGATATSDRVIELNPSRYPDLRAIDYCAAVLVGMLAHALGKDAPSLRGMITDLSAIGGLAAIADCASSLGIASRSMMRDLLSHGPNSQIHGLRALFTAADVSKPSTSDIAFRLAPMVNAAGRLQHAKTAFQLFDSPTFAEACTIAGKLADLNQRRKALQHQIVSDALAVHEQCQGRVLIHWADDWHPGVVGPAAGELAELLNIPVLLGAKLQGQGCYTFSARTAQGVNIHQLVSGCADGLPLHFGGHSQAMGLRASCNADGVAALHILRERLLLAAPQPARRRKTIDRYLSIATANWKNFAECMLLEPFDSNDNRTPCLCIPDVAIALRPSTSNQLTMRGEIEDRDGRILEVLSFRNRQIAEVRTMRGHVVGQLMDSNFRGRRTLKLLIQDIIPTDSSAG
jgi:Single-stranded DNA-specific exonuclease